MVVSALTCQAGVSNTRTIATVHPGLPLKRTLAVSNTAALVLVAARHGRVSVGVAGNFGENHPLGGKRG